MMSERSTRASEMEASRKRTRNDEADGCEITWRTLLAPGDLFQVPSRVLPLTATRKDPDR